MSYRPITDVWILARSKTKYYGAFPAGFLHRARALLGVGACGAVLHVCSGKIREYPYRGMGDRDMTLDLNPEAEPDYLRDARKPLPLRCLDADHARDCIRWTGADMVKYPKGKPPMLHSFWDAVLIDRPYTDEDADKYIPEGLVGGRGVLPTANELVKNAIAVVPVGGKVGIIDYLWPQPPKNATEVAVIAVGTGRNARARWFTVFERME